MKRFYTVNVGPNHWRVVDSDGYDIVLDVEGKNAQRIVRDSAKHWNREN